MYFGHLASEGDSGSVAGCFAEHQSRPESDVVDHVGEGCPQRAVTDIEWLIETSSVRSTSSRHRAVVH